MEGSGSACCCGRAPPGIASVGVTPASSACVEKRAGPQGSVTGVSGGQNTEAPRGTKGGVCHSAECQTPPLVPLGAMDTDVKYSTTRHDDRTVPWIMMHCSVPKSQSLNHFNKINYFAVRSDNRAGGQSH